MRIVSNLSPRACCAARNAWRALLSGHDTRLVIDLFEDMIANCQR